MQQKMPLLLTILLGCVLAPVIEETVFRVGFFELLFNKFPIFAWLVGAMAFGLLYVIGFSHPSDLLAFPIYFFQGIDLG